jgi:hypothetical protein
MHLDQAPPPAELDEIAARLRQLLDGLSEDYEQLVDQLPAEDLVARP